MTRNNFFFFWRCCPTYLMASSFLRFLHHTQRRITICRTPLEEWSARSRDLYLTKHNIHNKQISRPTVGFEPTTSAVERLQTYALVRAVPGTGTINNTVLQLLTKNCNSRTAICLLRNGRKTEYMCVYDKSIWNIVTQAVRIWVRKVQLRHEATLLGT